MKYNDNDAETVAAEALDADTELKGNAYLFNDDIPLRNLTKSYNVNGFKLAVTQHSMLYL